MKEDSLEDWLFDTNSSEGVNVESDDKADVVVSAKPDKTISCKG